MIGSPFADYLARGERVLWSGRPAQGLLLMPYDLFLVPFSILWTSMPLMGFIESLRSGGSEGPGWFVLPFVVVGLYLTVGRFLVDAAARAGTYYAVTDRRALILRRGLFSTFRSVDLDQALDVQVHRRLGGRGTIIFGPRESWWYNRNPGHFSPAFDSRALFLAIREPNRVYALISDRRS